MKTIDFLSNCRAEGKRQELLQNSSSFSAFLASLNVRIDIHENNNEELPRIAQLSSRTNQMNVGKLVLSETEIGNMILRGTHSTLTTTVTDRFGHYGLVGLAVYRNQVDTMPPENIGVHDGQGCSIPVLGVTIFLLSCRVLHRGVEHALLRELGDIAEKKGARYIRLNWIPSDRNEPARLFLWSLPSIIYFPCVKLIDHEAEIPWDTQAVRESIKGSKPFYYTNMPSKGYVFVPTEVAKECTMGKTSMQDLLWNAVLSKNAKGKSLGNQKEGRSADYSGKHGSCGVSDAQYHAELAYDGSSGKVLTTETYQYLSSTEVLEFLRSDVPTPLSEIPSLGSSETGPDAQRMKELWNELLAIESASNKGDVIQMYELQCKFRRKMRQQAKLTQYTLLDQGENTEDD
eukprot:gb/GECG01015830.1/.p1 GENE.gb/GECG01015830.1/~~gb/GECG01015830.1/.p1  ORF type:complete len:402 (+),score=40.49 gb/GECG01015830.1/:1-1206(+)